MEAEWAISCVCWVAFCVSDDWPFERRCGVIFLFDAPEILGKRSAIFLHFVCEWQFVGVQSCFNVFFSKTNVDLSREDKGLHWKQKQYIYKPAKIFGSFHSAGIRFSSYSCSLVFPFLFARIFLRCVFLSVCQYFQFSYNSLWCCFCWTISLDSQLYWNVCWLTQEISLQRLWPRSWWRGKRGWTKLHFDFPLVWYVLNNSARCLVSRWFSRRPRSKPWMR